MPRVWAVISLGPRVAAGLMQPTRSSRGTSSPSPACGLAPARPCSRWGLPGRSHCWPRRWSLAPPFHPCLVEAVVFCGPIHGLPRPGVARHRALGSADFPQAVSTARDRPADPLSTSILPWAGTTSQCIRDNSGAGADPASGNRSAPTRGFHRAKQPSISVMAAQPLFPWGSEARPRVSVR